MPQSDVRGLTLSGATERAAQLYDSAQRNFSLYVGDPVAEVDQAIAEAPSFAMAHALKAWLFLLGTEPGGFPIAREHYEKAKNLSMTAREKGHIAAIGHLVDNNWEKAQRVIEDVAIENPLDLLAIQAGHQMDFFTGKARMLRDRPGRALAFWSEKTPGYHAILGMHAFGLEESGDYPTAEKAGRRAVELERRDTWAKHAVAHVLEMQGRTKDGIQWMNEDLAGWSEGSSLAVHNWWHLALYHLEQDETARVLELYDGPIYGKTSQVVVEMLDAAALLWRLYLRGIDVGQRWQAVADAFEPIAEAGNYSFNDMHAVMALMGAGRPERAKAVLKAQEAAMARPDSNARFTREVGRPASEAMIAFAEGDYCKAVERLRPIRAIASTFGGSHAQRDVLDLTLIEAALRAKDWSLAAALASERLALKPNSPLNQRFLAHAKSN